MPDPFLLCGCQKQIHPAFFQQLITLPCFPAAVRRRRMQDPAHRQKASGGNHRPSGLHLFSETGALPVHLFSGPAAELPVQTAAAGQLYICGVHNGITGDKKNISFYQLNFQEFPSFHNMRQAYPFGVRSNPCLMLICRATHNRPPSADGSRTPSWFHTADCIRL